MAAMANPDYLAQSFQSLKQSTAVIEALPFRQTRSLAAAALASERDFETHYIRDAEAHERALFQPTPSTSSAPAPGSGGATHPGADAEAVGGGGGGQRWTATQMPGPKRAAAVREKASPLKDRRTASANDPHRALRAALKLLDVYSLPRAKEHVDALLAQHDGLSQTIAELEDALKRPLPRAPGETDTSAQDAAKEEDRRKEEMEIFALQQINSEKQAELDALLAQEVKRKQARLKAQFKPAPPPPPPIKTASTPPRPTARATIALQSPVRTSPRQTHPSAAARDAARRSLPPSPSTPKASSPRTIAPTTPPTIRKAPSRPAINATVTSAELEVVATKLWNCVGDVMRPWARRMLSRDGQVVPTPLASLSFSDTRKTLGAILASAPSTNGEPTSPTSSLATTLVSDSDDADPLPLPAAQLVEFELLDLFLSTLAGLPPVSQPAPLASPEDASSTPPPLTIVMRDCVLPSSRPNPSSPSSLPPMPKKGDKEPMVSMNALKAHLARFATSRGWKDDLGTTAIYGLVSKSVLRIDRRGQGGPMIGLRN